MHARTELKNCNLYAKRLRIHLWLEWSEATEVSALELAVMFRTGARSAPSIGGRGNDEQRQTNLEGRQPVLP
jgi:hypothetical protein